MDISALDPDDLIGAVHQQDAGEKRIRCAEKQNSDRNRQQVRRIPIDRVKSGVADATRRPPPPGIEAAVQHRPEMAVASVGAMAPLVAPIRISRKSSLELS